MTDRYKRAVHAILSTHRIWNEGQMVVLMFADRETARREMSALMSVRGTENYGTGAAYDRRPETGPDQGAG